MLGKWDGFRQRRIVAMDNYIAAIRKKRSLEIMLAYCYLHQLMKHQMKIVKHIKKARRIKYQLVFLCTIIACICKGWMKKFRDIPCKRHNEFR